MRINYDTKQNPPAEASEVFRLAVGMLSVSELESVQRQQYQGKITNVENEGILEKLDSASRLSLPFRDIFQKGVLNDKKLENGWRQEQAELLQGLVNWILFLWNTNWTLNPYCCGIHFESLLNHGKRHILITDITEIQHDCRGSEDHLYVRLFSLRLTFAEIILTTPLKLIPSKARTADSNAYPPIRDLNQPVLQRLEIRRDGVQKWKDTSEGKVVQEVLGKAGKKVADAIKTCLKFSVTTTDHRPGFFNLFREQILKP